MKVSQAHHGARARLGRLTAFGCALLTILTCSAADVGAPARPTTRLSSPHQPISGKRPLQPVDSGVAPVGPDPGPGLVRLPGHIPFALLRRLTPAVSDGGAAAMTLTLTLRRDDEVGFRKYLQEVYDPASGQFRHFLTQGQLTGHFGPSRQSYDEVRTYFVSHGFSVVAGSHNHLTLTVRGTRRQVEETLALHVRDFQIGDHRLFINDADPAVPRSLAPHLQAIVGLMTPPTPQPAALGEALVETLRVLNLQLEKACWDLQWAWDTGKWEAELDAYAAKIDAAIEAIYAELDAAAVESEILETGNPRATTKAARASTTHTQPTARAATRGGGQKIGITSSSTFQLQDVADWLALAKLPASLSSQVNKVDVAGGAAPGPAEADTLLAIATILNVAPGAQITVYDAPFAANAASFQSVFNAMINDGVTVISNTNIYCEDQTTLADVQSLDATLSAAAASGVTVLSATGDAGSSCQDGSANTIAVPTDSPHVTAVGGSSATAGPGNVYGTETWFNGTTQVPPIGAAGYGTSRFFNRPDYQSSLISSPMRSVPDVVAFADPAHAPTICQADAGGCPAAQIYGGTSLSTPIWAGLAAVLNQQLGKKLGLLNPTLYSQAAAATFHSASRLSSDPAHVGLGSPNFTRLYLALSGQTPGPVSATKSSISASTAPLTFFDGTAQTNTPVSVAVLLQDASGIPVAGKSVTLTVSGGSATLSAATVTTNTDNGVAVFTVSDATPESVTFSATDTTDSIVLPGTVTIAFNGPSATSAGISANPTSLSADGMAAASVVITLKDANGNPAVGKKVIVQSNGGAHAVITGPASGVTDTNGQIQFMATDQVEETVTFTAVDVSDAGVTVPGSAAVIYSGSAQTACNAGVLPVAAPGYTLTPYVTGQPSTPVFYYGNVNWHCPAGVTPAFSSSGTVLNADFLTGAVYRTGLGGGTVSTANLVTTLGPTLANLIFGKDGTLYATVSATGSSFNTGVLLQLDPSTGAQLRVIASGLTCPAGLAIDPLSGDLFFDDDCTGAGSDDPHIYRVIDPAGTDPFRPTAVVPYATLPMTPNAGMAFSPDGTLYAVSGYYSNTKGTVQKVSGTNQSAVTVTALPDMITDFGVAIGTVNADGSAQSLLLEPFGNLSEVPISNPAAAVVLATGGPGVGITGPDGCLYVTGYNGTYRIANASGTCGFAPTSPAPALTLTPTAVSPDPTQGSTQQLTAKLTNVSPLSGVPVLFLIGGANGNGKLARTDANGSATVTYTGLHSGTDTIFALYTQSDGSRVISNMASVTWDAGPDPSFLTLNSSPTGGTVGQPVAVMGSLVDIAGNPATAAPGQQVTFALGSATCAGITDSQGNASCQLTPAQAGSSALTAKFAGTPHLLAATAAAQFQAASPPVPTTTTVTVKAKSGGGAVDGYLLGALAVTLLLARARGVRRPVTMLSLVLSVSLVGHPRAAEAADSGFYLGIRAGGMQLNLDAGEIERKLAAKGYTDVKASVKNSAPAGTLYVGYGLSSLLNLELGYSRRDSQVVRLTATVPVEEVHTLLQDTARSLSGYGSLYTLSLRGRWEALQRVDIAPRLGGYFWDSRVTAAAPGDLASATHRGGGVTAGLGASYRLWRGLEVGVGVDYFHGSENNHAVMYGGSLEWRFGAEATDRLKR